MEQEIWKTAQYIFEDGHKEVFEKYQVSNMGRVKSLDYKHTGKEGMLNLGAHKTEDGSIYYHVTLYLNNKKRIVSVHRLVLSSFNQEGWFPNADVDHVKARSEMCDNSLSNLRWFTRKQNSSTEHCKEARSKATTNHPAISKRVKVTDLTTGVVTEYPSAYEAGRALGINLHTPATCINQRDGYYKKLGLHFAYV